MLEILKFIFKDIWHFLGTVILLETILVGSEGLLPLTTIKKVRYSTMLFSGLPANISKLIEATKTVVSEFVAFSILPKVYLYLGF